MESRYFEAIRSGDVDTLRRLLSERAELVHATLPAEASRGVAGRSGLHLAVQADRPEVAELLLGAGADMDARDAQGRTALHDSIEDGCQAIERLLLKRGAAVDINAAAILDRIEALEQMLDADSSLANDRSTGLSPLGWAAYGNRVRTAEALLRRGARMDDGELLCAASVGHVEVGRLLLDHGADPNAIHEPAGGSALHAAVTMRYTPDGRRFVRLLLEHGADPHLRTKAGQTALEVAELGAQEQARRRAEGSLDWERPFSEVAELLRSAG